MRTLFLFFFCLFNAFISSAQIDEYKEGDTLFVWATQGLLLRSGPDFDSPKITKLNYGEKVIILEVVWKSFEYEIAPSIIREKETYPRMVFTGYFMKIVHKGKEGYIYSRLLSRLSPIMENESMEEYFKRTMGQLKIVFDKKTPDSSYKRIIYKNGAILQEAIGPQTATVCAYLIPDISLREGYLLENKMRRFEEKYKSKSGLSAGWVDTHPMRFDPSGITLLYEILETITIESKDNWVIISVVGSD